MARQTTSDLAGVAAHLRNALDELPMLVRGDRSGHSLRMNLARAFADVGDDACAHRLLDDILAVSPDHRSACLLKIDLAILSGDAATALATAEAFPKAFASRVECLRRKVRALRKVGRHADAVPLVEELCRILPDDAPSFVELGRIRLSLGQADTAAAAFEKAMSLDRENAMGWIGRIDAANRVADPATACDIAMRGLAVLPEHPGLVEKAARALIALDRLTEARTLIEEAGVRGSPVPPGLQLALALVLRKTGHIEEARALLETLVCDMPRLVAAWQALGQLALEQDDVDGALDIIARGRSACPRSGLLARQHASVLRRADRHDAAREVLERLRRADRTDRAVAHALADLLHHLGHSAEADALYRETLASDPHDWRALKGRVAIARATGDLELALQLLEERPGAAQQRLQRLS